MELHVAVKVLDEYPPIRGTWWGDAVIACRDAARFQLEEDEARAAMDHAADMAYDTAREDAVFGRGGHR